MVTDSTSQTDDTTAFLRAARSGNLEKVIEYLDTDLDINTANSNGLNALHLSSKDGHVEIVTELLKRGAKVDAATKKGNTALHIASLAGQVDIVNILIQYGAAVNIQSQNGFTPLYMAAQENHDQVVKLLLSNGANQSLATEDGFTPLAVAMQQGHDKVVSVLLENDSKGKVRLPALHIAAKKDDCKAADLLLQNDHKPDVTSKSGFTPLHIAAHYGNEEIARLLIKRGADVNYLAKHNISPLHVAAKWGKNNMVKILLENSAMIDAKTRDGLTPLHCAARSGHEEVVSTLLDHEAPISARTKNGLAPLHMASQGDHVDAARALLYHRAPVDEVTIDYLTSLHVAAHCGHVRVAKLLLDRKADPNARALNGFTPLHIACKKNRIKVVELLLKHGASIESTTESGLTPLHVASFMGCMNIVIFLLQHEANPDVPTVRGETPLHLAARANQTDIIRILLRNGAKVDARAREEQTPLHIASRLGNVDIVMLLLQHGAAVDTTTKDMYTALHIAAKEGQEEVAAILVENHASVKAATKNGFTPLHIAAKYGNMNVAKILLQKDSKLDAQGKNDITPLHLACHYDHSNVANMILEKGASPHLASQNGHTPLHIAARKNQMDIASTLLEHGADPNVQSKAGFTPLQLSAQKGHYDMTNLLIEHGADPNHKAKNGLTALHLCAQEDFIRVASILVKNGANVESETETGYRPIHVAAHFGNLSMIRFLLKHNAQIDVRTNQNYTPLHQAAQQGHAHIVSALLEGNASHNARTTDGLTALNVAQKLGYISVMEVLKGLSYDTLTPDNRTWEEKYKVIAPESLQETSFMSDSDDEGGSDGLINEQPYRYLTADLMKSLRDDSLPIDVTRDDPIDRQVSKEEKQEFVQSNNYCLAETFDTNDSASLARLHFRSFLVSFLVDARGGAMKGCRHSGIRIIVPPRRATMPIRVTCRLIKPSKVANPPSLMEGEALATRIIEMGPVGASFLGPVLIDVPHFASVQGKEREILILRSENGETWKEHDHSYDNDDTLFNTPHGIKRVINTQMSASHSGRIMRILTTEFPQYFAIVTRIKQEVHVIGADGGILISSVANHVQAVFPPGALTKKIKVGLQAHVIPAELTAKLLGNCVAVSPVITIEPRRRKFHKPITLTIPVPQAANKGMINQYGGETPTLRLLCSIAGGTSEAQWEDVTGSTPLTFMNDRVSFTTTVSARFWLMDCRNVSEVPKMATELYKESLFVPFITNFVIYTKRMDLIEATLRILCMTDGKECIHTLEKQEEFLEIVKSRDVEALDGKDLYIEFSGNLVPVTKSGVQLKFTFKAFRQNRLSFHVKVRDPLLDPVARMMFMRDPKVAKGEPSQQPICVLNIVLPDSTVSGESEKKLNEYEDSNINGGKMERFKSSYTKEEGEKGDKPKPSSPSEPKFITDILQKEQTDAATIHESFAQKAACPLESVDASYPSNVSVQDELSPTNEKQTYTEKRKFWEDITRKRENYQRSESELSRTSQLTVNESDSEFCIQNIVSEEETAEAAVPGRSETMEDLNIPDISECSVAEKAHYFEEQIQKELSTSRPTSKLITQESTKEKDPSATRVPSKVTSELSSEKSEKTEEEAIDRKVDKDDWNLAESLKTEKISTIVDETPEKTTTTESEKKVKGDVEIRDSVTTTVERIEHETETSKGVLVEKIEKTRRELIGELVEEKKSENTIDEGTSSVEKKLPVTEEAKKRQPEKSKIPSKIPETKKHPAPDFESPGKICAEFLHHETKIGREEPTSEALGSERDFTERESQKETETRKRDDAPEKMEQVDRSEAKISTPSVVPEGKTQKEDQQPSMIPRKIRTEAPTKPEAKRAPLDEAKQSLAEPQLGVGEDSSVADQDVVTPEDKESTSPSEKVALKMQEEAKQSKKESRIPISAAKAEKEKKPKEDISSKISASPTERSPTTLTRSPSASEGATSPKREFESRIPKRSAIPKAQEKEAKEPPTISETVTETRTTEELSSQHYQKHTSETKTKTFSKTFVGQPKDAAKIIEVAETKIERDSSVVSSKFDHRASTETKEVSSSEDAGPPEKFVKHEESEHKREEKLAESTVTRATPQEIAQERTLESLKSNVTVAQEISMSLKDGKESVDAMASQFNQLAQRSASSMDRDGAVVEATEESSVKEREIEASVKIERDDEEDGPLDLEEAMKRATTRERQFEESVVSEVKTVLPSGLESQEFSSGRETVQKTGTKSFVPETLEESVVSEVKTVLPSGLESQEFSSRRETSEKTGTESLVPETLESNVISKVESILPSELESQEFSSRKETVQKTGMESFLPETLESSVISEVKTIVPSELESQGFSTRTIIVKKTVTESFVPETPESSVISEVKTIVPSALESQEFSSRRETVEKTGTESLVPETLQSRVISEVKNILPSELESQEFSTRTIIVKKTATESFVPETIESSVISEVKTIVPSELESQEFSSRRETPQKTGTETFVAETPESSVISEVKKTGTESLVPETLQSRVISEVKTIVPSELESQGFSSRTIIVQKTGTESFVPETLESRVISDLKTILPSELESQEFSSRTIIIKTTRTESFVPETLDSSVISEMKTIIPSELESQEFSSRTETAQKSGTETFVPETPEETEDRTTKEVEARSIAETIIQSIQTEIAKRSASLEGIKQLDSSESDSKDYSENTMDMDTKESEVLHDRMADNMMKKFEDIMERRSRSHSQVLDENELLPERLRSVVASHDENLEKISNRGSISVSEDLTKDEESTPHDREGSFPSSSSHPKLLDRDITMSPSSISEQIDLDDSMESEKSTNVESARHGIEKRSLPEVVDGKLGAEISRTRAEETPDSELVHQSRQDSIDVPSLDIDESRSLAHQELTGDSSSSFERYSREPVEFSSIHESPAIESLDKICLDRDITVSPSTVSEDTNIDFSLVQDRVVDRTEKLADLVMKGISADIEGPPVISPRLRIKELEIKPVNWMIGDEKIEVSEPLQPSQAFDKELEEYQSSIVRQKSETLSRDGSADFEQESGTRSSEDVSAIDSVKETFVQGGTRTPSSTKSSKFTVVPVSEVDFESELVENRLDISCQELVDTLQREYEAKTPTTDGEPDGSRYTFETATQGISKKTPDFSVHTERIMDSSGAIDAGLSATGDVFIEVPRFPAREETRDDTVISETLTFDDGRKLDVQESSAGLRGAPEVEEEVGEVTSKISGDVKSELEVKEKDALEIDKETLKISNDVKSELEVREKDALDVVKETLKISDDVESELEVNEKDALEIVEQASKISEDLKTELEVEVKDASEIVKEVPKISADIKTELEVKDKDVSEIVEEAQIILDDVKTELEVKEKDASEIVKEASKISADIKIELEVKEKDASEIIKEAAKISADIKTELEVKEKDACEIVKEAPKISANTETELEVKEKDAFEIVKEAPKISADTETELEVKEKDAFEIVKEASKISADIKTELEVKEKDAFEIVKEVPKISADIKTELEVKEKDASEIVKEVPKISADIKTELEVKEKDASEVVKEAPKISADIKTELEVKEKDASEVVKEAPKISADIKTELEIKEKDASEVDKEVPKISADIKTEQEVKEKDASEVVKEAPKISADIKTEQEVKEKDASEVVTEVPKISADIKTEQEVKEKDAPKSVKIPSKISGETKSDVTLKGLKQTSPSKSTKSSLDESKHQEKSGSPSHPADTSAFKLKKEDLPSVDLSARYAITVLDQAVKKEIAEVKESLEAAKQDLIEELNENSETVFQIKESPSEFQFKLEPETIPNDLPFLYKAPSFEQVIDHEAVQQPATEGSPIAKPRRVEASTTEEQKEISTSDKSEEETIQTAISSEEKSHSEPIDSRTNVKIIQTKESEKTKKTVHKDSGDFSAEESYSHSMPVAASRSSSDVDAKEESVSLLAPQPAPRRRQKPARASRKVTSESDAGSSSGDSSNYQSCDYEIGSGSRPSSSDIEALQSTLPSGTVSEYETALMSIEHSSASRPTSQEYQSAASTLSSRESMKSLNSLSSGHLGSIDSTGELSETLVASEAEDEEDKDHIDDNLECALDEDRAAKGSDSSGSDMQMEDAFDKIDDGLPCRMKRSSEMIFQQIVDEAAGDEGCLDEELGPDEETRFDESTTEQLPSDTLAEDEEAFRTDSIFMSTDLTSEAYDKSLASMESKTDVPEGQIEGRPGAGELQGDAPFLDTHIEAEKEAEEDSEEEAERDSEEDAEGETNWGPESANVDEVLELMRANMGELLHQASITSSTSGAMSFETVIEKDQKIDRHSPDSDSFELVDKPDIIDDFVVIEEVGREAEEFDSEGKSISIGAISYTSTKKYDREVENLITESKDDSQVSTSQAARNNDLFEFESEESPPQASNDDQYSQSLSDDENFEGSKKWMEMQFQNDPRGYDLDYDRGRLEDIKEEEITDFEAGSSRFGSLGSHKGSIGSVGSLRGSFGSTTEYDVLAGKKCFSKPTEHDNISLSSLQEFEHLESTVAMENSRKLQCGSQESVNNGSLPRRYITSRSGHGDDVSLSSLKDFEGLESICREAHLIELRAREEEDLLDHESPENRYKLENLPRPKVAEPVSAAGSFNPSTSGSDDYEKRIMEIDEIIRIAQANVEKFDRQDDTTEDISQIEITADAERIEAVPVLPTIPAESDDPQHPVRDSNVMETSTDSLELEENADKKYNPLCRSSDSLEMKTTIDYPSLSSDSLNNVRDTREAIVDPTADQFNSGRRISSDSLEMPLLEQHDPDSHEKSSESHGSYHVKGSFDDSVEQTSTTDTKITNNGKTRSPSTSDT